MYIAFKRVTRVVGGHKTGYACCREVINECTGVDVTVTLAAVFLASRRVELLPLFWRSPEIFLYRPAPLFVESLL